MTRIRTLLLAGTLIPGAALLVHHTGAQAAVLPAGPLMAQAETAQPQEVPPEELKKRGREQRQQEQRQPEQEQRQERAQPQRQEQRQERQQQIQEQRQERQEQRQERQQQIQQQREERRQPQQRQERQPPAPAERPAEPPVPQIEKQAPAPQPPVPQTEKRAPAQPPVPPVPQTEKQAPQTEKQAPAERPDRREPRGEDRKQNEGERRGDPRRGEREHKRQDEGQGNERGGSEGRGTPPLPSGLERPAPQPPADAATPPAEAPGGQSVAPQPPPAGEQPAIPVEELKGGKLTPEMRQSRERRIEREFQQRDRRMDERFGRKVEEQGDRTIIREGDNRVIVREGDRVIIRSDETERLRRNARDVREERRGNEMITVIQRPNGVEVVTVKDRDGNLIRRYRRENGREISIIDNRRAWERGGRWDSDRGWRDRGRDQGPHFYFGLDLPPVVINIPRDEYIIEADRGSYDDFEDAFLAPPLVRTERPYSVQEVTQNVRLRERVRSIDLNTINFATAEWRVADDQVDKLEDLARAIQATIDDDPTQVYLIEGHTDAVGSALDNLSLSDRRAEEVAAILTEHYDIPAENLVTQGYGEDYLKVNTLAANAENRRVTVRNITHLLNAQANAQ